MSSSDSLLGTSDSDSEDELFVVRRPKIYKSRVTNFNEWLDDEFYSRFRLSKRLTLHVLEHIRGRISSRSNRGGAIKAETKLLLTLRFYATGNLLISVSDFVGVSVASGSRIVKEVSKVLASLKPNFIQMPRTPRELNEAALEFFNIAHFPTCCGAIDCTHIKIISPGGDDAEIYRNRKGYFSLNVQTVSDAKLRIRNLVARWPGSCHDQTIFNNSTLKRDFDSGRFGSFRLIGDSGYALKSYLFTPLPQPHTEPQQLYNEAHIHTRNVVERQYGVWKRRFPILALGMKVHLNTAMVIIVATAVLHNMAINMNDIMPEFFNEEPEADVEVNQQNQEAIQAGEVRNIFINEHFTL